MKKKLSIFWSKGFIIALAILLLNDHFLKSAFHNWFTGKLSDIAGLFIFPIFYAAFLPRYKKHIYWITAIGFIWWKSPLSAGAIDLVNGLNIFQIERVVDWTDLIALAILPFSFLYFSRYKETSLRLNPLPVILLASFAFIATSKSPEKIECYKEYSFQYPIDSLKEKVFFHRNISNFYRKQWLQLDSISKTPTDLSGQSIEVRKRELENEFFKSPMWINIEYDKDYCEHLTARITLTENNHISKLVLYEFQYRTCSNTKTPTNKELLKEAFEKKIIQPLLPSK